MYIDVQFAIEFNSVHLFAHMRLIEWTCDVSSILSLCSAAAFHLCNEISPIVQHRTHAGLEWIRSRYSKKLFSIRISKFTEMKTDAWMEIEKTRPKNTNLESCSFYMSSNRVKRWRDVSKKDSTGRWVNKSIILANLSKQVAHRLRVLLNMQHQRMSHKWIMLHMA